jgi:hypothetical protein
MIYRGYSTNASAVTNIVMIIDAAVRIDTPECDVVGEPVGGPVELVIGGLDDGCVAGGVGSAMGDGRAVTRSSDGLDVAGCP